MGFWEAFAFSFVVGVIGGFVGAYLAWRRLPRWVTAFHTPQWEPAQLPIDAEGNTRPGYVCTHELENGNGRCGGNVFTLDQEVAPHCCMVRGR